MKFRITRPWIRCVAAAECTRQPNVKINFATDQRVTRESAHTSPALEFIKLVLFSDGPHHVFGFLFPIFYICMLPTANYWKCQISEWLRLAMPVNLFPFHLTKLHFIFHNQSENETIFGWNCATGHVRSHYIATFFLQSKSNKNSWHSNSI